MIVDITDIINEIAVDVEFRRRTMTVDNFGRPTFAETRETIKAAIVESKFLNQKIVSDIPVEFSGISVWVRRADIEDTGDLMDAIFVYEGEEYEITGKTTRGSRTRHNQYFAIKRVDS